MLVAGEHAIQIDEELVAALASMAGKQLSGFLTRRVLPTLDAKQQELLRAWLVQHSWDAVPLDALFTAGFVNEDWWPE